MEIKRASMRAHTVVPAPRRQQLGQQGFPCSVRVEGSLDSMVSASENKMKVSFGLVK